MKKSIQKGLTPAMSQWFALKEEHKDALLFFRMGDFYELFFNDAIVASSALDIVLTQRGKYDGQAIPMCGVPHATAPAYLAKLVRRGFRVAIAEQTQSSTQRGVSKGPLQRHVVRLVTPGTLTEEELLEPGRSNFLLALNDSENTKKKNSVQKNMVGAAWIDVSTGYFATQSLPKDEVMSLIVRLDPAEILLSRDKELDNFNERKTIFPLCAQQEDVVRMLADIFNVSDLSAYGTFTDLELRSAYMVARYVEHTQAGVLPHLLPPSSLDKEGFLRLDPSTRLSLDIVSTREGEKSHTLFDVVDCTVSASGERLLSNWLSTPLLSIIKIQKRQEAWMWLADHDDARERVRLFLKQNPDMMRALGRISFGRDLKRSFLTIAAGLNVAHKIYAYFSEVLDTVPSVLLGAIEKLNTAHELGAVLQKALIFDSQEKDKIIASSYDEKLAQYRDLTENSKKIAASLQEKYAQKFGVSSLKIRHHAQMGYVFEVPISEEQNLRAKFPELFFRKGTKNAARFATQELVDLNLNITQADENAQGREQEIVEDIRQKIIQQTCLPDVARSLAIIDVLQSCAVMGTKTGWVRPVVTNDLTFDLQACCHPVVEAALPSGSDFVPNDCDLSQENRLMLLTGPNMAGKSTYLRQVALMIILAQSGLPISAESGHIGVVDQLFSRVGAADDLVRGQSTFMVEMTETAAILNQAGPHSFVVVDEIGRGTATIDGLAIAQAVLENLHSTIGCRGIFATHFHELAKISASLPHICLHTMAVKEWEGKIIFLHEVIQGDAKRSWGVHVAQLAGIPQNVVRRAGQIVKILEDEKHKQKKQASLPLFEDAATAVQSEEDKKFSLLRERVENLNLNDMTPKQALDTLYQLAEIIEE